MTTRDILYLFFVARQGYWDVKDEMRFSGFLIYLYPYVLGTLAVLLIYIIVGKELLTFLDETYFLNMFRYSYLYNTFLFLIFPVVLIYENYHTYKSNTEVTFSLFFGISALTYQKLLLVKNMLVALPAFALALFSQFWIFCLLMLLAHVASILYLSNVRQVSILRLERLMPPYFLTVIDYRSVLKCIFVPLISFAFFLVMSFYQPNLTGTALGNNTSSFYLGIFLGTMLYSNKGLPYLFLGMVKDLPYLKVIGVDIKRFLGRQLKLMLSLIFGLSVVPLLIYYLSSGFLFIDVLLLILGLSVTFLVLQGMQMTESLFLREKAFQSVKELENYRFPMTYLMKIWLSRLLFLVVLLLGDRLNGEYASVVIAIITLSLLSLFIGQYRKVLEQYIKQL